MLDAMKAAKVPEWFINSCQTVKYLFPKAHAIAYVLMAYRIAYCKVHYPKAFYAAYFSVRAPEFDAAYEELGEDIHFLMVNMTDGSRETVETATAFIEEAGYSFPVLYDTESDAAISYQAYSLPTTYFIDAEGYMIARATGALDADTLQQGIDMILS